MAPYERSSSSLSAASQGLGDTGSSHSSTSQSRRNSSPTSPQPACTSLDAEIKSARDGSVGSLLAVLHFLQRQGVSASSIQELKWKMDQQNYVAVMQRAQQYCACLPSSSSHPCERVAVHYLLIGCWTSLCRYLELQYRQAYEHHHGLRRQTVFSSNSRRIVLPDEVEKALEAQVSLAEQCCTCQRELILAQRNEQLRLRMTTKATAAATTTVIAR